MDTSSSVPAILVRDSCHSPHPQSVSLYSLPFSECLKSIKSSSLPARRHFLLSAHYLPMFGQPALYPGMSLSPLLQKCEIPPPCHGCLVRFPSSCHAKLIPLSGLRHRSLFPAHSLSNLNAFSAPALGIKGPIPSSVLLISHPSFSAHINHRELVLRIAA